MRSLALVLVALAAACGDNGSPAAADAGPDADTRDIADRLAAIPGMTVVEAQSDVPGYRYFQLAYVQPVDHDDPAGATFVQRMSLMHKDTRAPMILHTSGYDLYDGPFLAELTALLGANQLSIEERFFTPSRPDPADWTKLTIAQAAADHHRAAEALRPLYGAPWISTGASKGGMTSIYHRRFYPDDVIATVAYVAPLSFGAPDPRYLPFFDQVGDPTCRQALKDYQRALLQREPAMHAKMVAFGQDQGLSFALAGGPDAAFEDSAIDFPWGFWQYGDASGCAAVPAATASDDALFAYHVGAGGLAFYDDATVRAFQPYYYQADFQIGYPDEPKDYLADLLTTQDQPRSYLPTPVTYEPTAMQDIDDWVQHDGSRLLFIYGENDPWGYGQFRLGAATDSFELVAPGQNHGASIATLAPADQTVALAALAAWSGVQPDLASPLLRAGVTIEPRPRLPPPRLRARP